MFGEDVDDELTPIIEEAVAAVAEHAPGGIDDLLLLQRLLELADDNILRALGSRSRSLLRDVISARESLAAGPDGWRPVPDADDVIRFAASEAFDLGGYSSRVGPIHVLLALFAFRGAASEHVLQKAGIDWRPLRSIVRRLGLSW